jgi:hypothetical protein
MALYLGSNSISKAYFGSSAVSQMYQGSTELLATGLPPVGNYVTSNLAYYYDFGDTNSYPGTGTDITNLAPSATKLGDGEIWSGTLDQGSKTLTNSTFDATTGTLQLGGSGGTFVRETTDQSWFGDITSTPTTTWPSAFTVEIGYYYYPHNWSNRLQFYFHWSQRNAGPGQWGSLNLATIGQIADYSFTPTLSPSTGTAQIAHYVWSGNNLKRYINGSVNGNITISTTRKNASGSPFAWGILYTKEGGLDRIDGPTWSKYQYVRFYWDRALSPTEVTQNYDANKARLGLS